MTARQHAPDCAGRNGAQDRGKHTPGPWWTDGEYSADECGVAVIAARTDCGPLPGNPTRGMVAFVSELLPENADRATANARLIAAAPELLEALKQAEQQIDYGQIDAAHRIIIAAIAKAEGLSDV